MDCQNGKSCELKKNSSRAKGDRSSKALDLVSLNDVPLEIRCKEAKKPLFLARYE
jgi:hypothetical protein